MKKKIKLIWFLFIFFKNNYFYKNNYFFLKKYFLNFNKILMCFNCHLNNNYNYKFKIYKIPIIINQNKEYIENSLLNYKNFFRKSIYMNIISNYLSNLDILNISIFFSKVN